MRLQLCERRLVLVLTNVSDVRDGVTAAQNQQQLRAEFGVQLKRSAARAVATGPGLEQAE